MAQSPKSKLSLPRPTVSTQTLQEILFEEGSTRIKLDPSEPFKVRQRKEKERKEQKALFAIKVERLKEVLNLKEKYYEDAEEREAQQHFQEAYDQIYGYSNSRLQSHLQRLEEYFHSSPDSFNVFTAHENLEVFEKRKAKLQKIAQEEKNIQNLAKEKSGIAKLIKQYNIQL